MNIRLILMGKTEAEYLKTGTDLYTGRLSHYCKFSIVEIPELKNAKSLTRDQIKEKEGELILKNVKPQDELILLDERGKMFSSVEWAAHMENKFLHSTRDIVFSIGGAYGFSQAVYDRAGEKISLSKMTFSHQLVRVIFLEQLYRMFTIIKGEPYHHE
ncbi:MAG: 23S rRNA (pseudouridine(1915)-N(3))-methyltransferase RlmH [Bacteroidales bacterium]|nr:23S rRNA (pseudouridine(1915)-N(3))-methyltransferase RlmH [Candidatus Equibacterium intestinale]